MNTKQYTDYLLGQMMFQIWNPDKFSYMKEGKLKRQSVLTWRTRGVILHDRALNGEYERMGTTKIVL